MTKFDTETVKMVADALGCFVPTAAERREAAEMLRSLVAERDQYAAREAHFSKVLSVCDGGQYRNDWDAAIRRVLAERDDERFRADTNAEAHEAAMRFVRLVEAERDTFLAEVKRLRELLYGGGIRG